MSKEIKSLLNALEKEKDKTSSHARGIRRKLRNLDHYVGGSGKKEKKGKVKKSSSKKSKREQDPEEDFD